MKQALDHGEGSEAVCEYLIAHGQQKAGTRFKQGPWKPALALDMSSPGLRLVAEFRLWRVERAVAAGLVAWSRGERRVHVLRHVPTVDEVLSWQAAGERCVSLLPDGTSTGPHEDGFAFALHDLCHLEKMADPEHYAGQVGFFSQVQVAKATSGWAALEARYDDDAWREDRDHVLSDMNGSCIFLFAALKMKLKMAERRAVARERGVAPPTGGPLSKDEETAFEAALETLLDLLALEGQAREAARRVSTKHDFPEDAVLLCEHFEQLGLKKLSEAP